MNKLIHHQLKNLDSISGKQILKEEQIEPNNIKSYLFLKGYFFFHYRSLKSRVSPKMSNPLHLSGWWCKKEEFIHIKDENIFWHTVDRLNWISPFRDKKEIKILNHHEIMDHIQSQGNKSQLVLRLQKIENKWVEIDRGFVVPNKWPELSHA